MKIVFDFSNRYNNDRTLSIFTTEFWLEMALVQPGHEFIFLGDATTAPDPPAGNIKTPKLKKTGIGWFDKKKLNNAVARWQADCLVSMRGAGFFIHHLLKEKNAGKTFPLTDQWISFNHQAPAKASPKLLPAPVVKFIRPACSNVITSLSWTEGESIKTQYTGGRAFFLFVGNISEQQQLVELLKAFSAFKKWQQSNMQLVIAGYTTSWTQVFEEKLLNYKYRADIVLLKNLTTAEIAKLMAACYAVLYPAAATFFPLAMVWALQSNKAIIASGTDHNRQMIASAEWVPENNTADGFAKAMILLYKDEKHLQLLVQQAAQQQDRRQMLDEVWACIEK